MEDGRIDSAGGSKPHMVINAPLCFIINKRGRLPMKEMKDLLFNFYNNDAIIEAKEIICESIQTLKIDGAPKMRKRRDSKEFPDSKLKLDIDDLLMFITYIDEKGLIDRLPTFVTDRPDSIPSQRLLEGDMLAVLNKLTRLEERCASLQSAVDALASVRCTIGGGAVRRIGTLINSGRGGGGSGHGEGQSVVNN